MKPLPSLLQPAGTPVSQALKLLPLPLHLPRLTHALTALDSVHGDGALPSIGVDVYKAIPGGLMASFQVDKATGVPVGIVISPSSPAWGMSLLHELGHFLDWSGLGTPGAFASAGDPTLAAWLSAVDSTPTVRTLRHHLTTPFALTAPGGAVEWVDVAGLSAYWLQKEELFARSYAQYIVTRSADPVMVSELQVIQSRTPFMALSQWTPAEFTVISAEFDRLFYKRGWMS